MINYLLAIDQGTTNSRAIIFDNMSHIIAQHELPLKQYYPEDGWVEQNPLEMFGNTLTCCRKALNRAGLQANQIAAIGISNQRETTIIWDKISGLPIYPAIVWQDRRTAQICQHLSQKTSLQTMILKKTGLLLDPYFSATKILWILENVDGAREKALRQEILFGTVDTFLLWKLTQGKTHATDATNASRTLLFNIHTQEWDKEILEAFNIPASMLPEVLDNTCHFGETDTETFGKRIQIAGMAGDQQAATIGQACFSVGMVKATYGTGGFMLLNTGDKVIHSHHRLLSTVIYRIQNKVTYGLEGSIFAAGATIKWLRDELKIIEHAEDSETMAKSIENTQGSYLVPAFTGLGAPYWDPNARAALIGLSSKTGREHIVRAGLESVAYQTNDLLRAMSDDSQFDITTLRVDGGMSENAWLLQFLSDILNIEIERPLCIETTALGVSYLAGLHVGIYQSLDDIAQMWQMNARFTPRMANEEREILYKGWQEAIGKVTHLR